MSRNPLTDSDQRSFKIMLANGTFKLLLLEVRLSFNRLISASGRACQRNNPTIWDQK